jgi:monovalent cation/hydrogen antiporter
VFAIYVAQRVPDLISAKLRIQSYAVWEVVVFVLNVLAFILIGLQLKPILARLSTAELARYAAAAIAVCATVILVRIVWVMGYTTVARWAGAKLSTAGAAVVAWCGMRGIVTLAAALALPDGGSAAFPYRDFILFTAFSVVLGTLVVQGMTVGPLMKLVALRDDGSVDREVRLARAETARAALAAMDGATGAGAAGAGAGAGEMVGFLRRKYQARLRRAEQGDDALDPAEADGWRDFGGVQRRAFTEERRRLSDLRARGVIGDDAFHRVEEELDWAEVNAESRRL